MSVNIKGGRCALMSLFKQNICEIEKKRGGKRKNSGRKNKVKCNNKCYEKVSKVLNFTIEKFEFQCYNQMQIFGTKRY